MIVSWPPALIALTFFLAGVLLDYLVVGRVERRKRRDDDSRGGL